MADTFWSEAEAAELVRDYMTPEERLKMAALVGFAEMGRSRPGSTWGVAGQFGIAEEMEATEGEQSSAEMVAGCDRQMAALLRRAFLRKAAVFS